MLLRAGDRQAWSAWLTKAFEQGVGPTESQVITAILGEASESTKAQIITAIRHHYTKLEKKIPGGPDVGPKRVADFLINAIIRPERYFKITKDSGMQAEIALQIYFREVNKILGPAIGEPFNTEDLRMMVTTLQKSLRASYDERIKDKRAIMLFGSTSNGRGRPGKSDIEIAYENPNTRIPIFRIQSEINTNLKAQGTMGITNIDDGVKSFDHNARFARINPIQIKITADKVEIVVYPQRSVTDTNDSLTPIIYDWF